MDVTVMFLDCPADLGPAVGPGPRGAGPGGAGPAGAGPGAATRCGLPAEVEYWYALGSTDGPLESAKIRCPRGHWFNGPVESLIRTAAPGAADGAAEDAAERAGRSPAGSGLTPPRGA